MSRKSAGATTTGETEPLVRRHLRLGWWSLLVFLTMGIALEAMHGLKLDAYLNVANETRRLMWTLAHAHGVLLGLVHVAFAATLKMSAATPGGWSRVTSLGLLGATVLLPGGFLLGGAVVHGGDPGRGVLLVPFGAALLFVAVLLVALRGTR